jgi:hypothetical protein
MLDHHWTHGSVNGSRAQNETDVTSFIRHLPVFDYSKHKPSSGDDDAATASNPENTSTANGRRRFNDGLAPRRNLRDRIYGRALYCIRFRSTRFQRFRVDVGISVNPAMTASMSGCCRPSRRIRAPDSRKCAVHRRRIHPWS